MQKKYAVNATQKEGMLFFYIVFSKNVLFFEFLSENTRKVRIFVQFSCFTS